MPFTPSIEAVIDGNPVEPSGECPFLRLEGVQGAIDLNKYLLKHIFCLMGIA